MISENSKVKLSLVISACVGVGGGMMWLTEMYQNITLASAQIAKLEDRQDKIRTDLSQILETVSEIKWELKSKNICKTGGKK